MESKNRKARRNDASTRLLASLSPSLPPFNVNPASLFGLISLLFFLCLASRLSGSASRSDGDISPRSSWLTHSCSLPNDPRTLSSGERLFEILSVLVSNIMAHREALGGRRGGQNERPVRRLWGRTTRPSFRLKTKRSSEERFSKANHDRFQHQTNIDIA